MPWQNTLVCPSNFIKARRLLTKPNKPDGSWWIRMVGGGNKIHPPSWKLFKSLEFVSKTSTASLCKPSRSRPPPAAKVQLVQQQRKQGQDDKIIEGSLEVKLPTIWTDEKQSRAEAERRERLEERRVEEKESEERRCRCAKR